jgi:hypothetical protein
MAPVTVERLDLGWERAGKPAQCARGAVVLGEVYRIRAVTDRKAGLRRTAARTAD